LNYLEINITISPALPWRELINADLGDIGFESFVDKEDGTQAFIRVDDFSEEKLTRLLESYNDSCKTTFSKKEIESVNWNEEWEKNFDPIFVGDNCVVRATFHQLEKQYPYDIIINPKMSFGTGHHATTHLMIQEMLTIDLKGTDVLDMGCGTSVLAILASKLEAKTVLAIDNDQWAVDNSVENIKLNNIENVETVRGSDDEFNGKRFNIILANINLNVLLAQIDSYYSAMLEEGVILFSGVLEKDVSKLYAAVKQIGFSIIDTKQKDKWVMVRCKK
jgi:ribosomal protein L11 methyltransferase